MMEIPTISKTWVDSDGVTVYTVLYKDGSTCDMTIQQYDYLKASAQAVLDLDSKASAESQPEEISAPPEPEQRRFRDNTEKEEFPSNHAPPNRVLNPSNRSNEDKDNKQSRNASLRVENLKGSSAILFIRQLNKLSRTIIGVPFRRIAGLVHRLTTLNEKRIPEPIHNSSETIRDSREIRIQSRSICGAVIISSETPFKR